MITTFDCSSVMQRVLIFLLCFIIMFTLLIRPVTVSANTASGLLEIGTSYGDVATVAPYLIPFILIISGLDWYYSNIDEIVAKAEELYNNASTAVRSWAEDVGSKLKQGTSTRVRIPTEALDEVGTAVGVLVSGVVSYLVVPKVLSRIDTLTREDIFADTYLEALTKTNTLVGGISSSISTLINTVIDVPSLINAKVIALTAALKEWQSLININLGNWFDGIGTVVHAINGNMLDWFQRIGASVYGVNDKFAWFRVDFSDFATKALESFNNIKTSISAANVNVSPLSWVNDLIDGVSTGVLTNTFTEVRAWLANIADFFAPSSDDDDIPFWDFLFGRNEGASVWNFFSDNSFLLGLHSFYDFVGALWAMFPLVIRYLLIFGFVFPFMFSVIKLFAG